MGDTSTSKLHLSLEIFRWNYECTRLGGFLILIPFDRGVFWGPLLQVLQGEEILGGGQAVLSVSECDAEYPHPRAIQSPLPIPGQSSGQEFLLDRWVKF